MDKLGDNKAPVLTKKEENRIIINYIEPNMIVYIRKLTYWHDFKYRYPPCSTTYLT